MFLSRVQVASFTAVQDSIGRHCDVCSLSFYVLLYITHYTGRDSVPLQTVMVYTGHDLVPLLGAIVAL